jgi:hypothetical protein
MNLKVALAAALLAAECLGFWLAPSPRCFEDDGTPIMISYCPQNRIPEDDLK